MEAFVSPSAQARTICARRDDAVGERAGVGEGQQLGLILFAEEKGGAGTTARHERTPVN